MHTNAARQQRDISDWLVPRSPSSQRHGMTTRGKVRARNEDQFAVATLHAPLRVECSALLEPDAQPDPARVSCMELLVVADGVGGQSGGDVASRVVIEATLTEAARVLPWMHGAPSHQVRDALSEVVHGAHAALFTFGEEHPEYANMSTTLTVACVVEGLVVVAHVGDSRCYRIRREGAEQLTSDHTLSRQMIDRGEVTPEQARRGSWANVLLNAVSATSETVRPDIFELALDANDILLLCTDGITKHLDDPTIHDLVMRDGAAPAAEICRRLVDAANERGGTDNATVVVRLPDARRGG
jgi:protein phosphatase